ncbi:MAG: DUF2520 domain-containing protein [Lachnospiraceae bacterium]|nr:DUF2520 domain-containing protein [Lachnospiraceae bacterium]
MATDGKPEVSIGFLGAGKVGFSLGKYLVDQGLYVSGYYSRNPASAKEASVFAKTGYYTELKELVQESDILFLTVSDGEIINAYTEIIQLNIDLRGKYLAHCSGALSSTIFSGIHSKGAKGCSVHPICAVSSKQTGYQDLSKTYFTIEGEDTALIEEIFRFCQNPVERISAEKKVRYHAAAVYASNLVVGLYDKAVQLLQECGLSAEFSAQALKPLFLGNAENIGGLGVIQALTGPVERADEMTIEKHLAILEGEDREIYRLLSKQLVKIAKQKHPERDYEKLSTLLEREQK